MQAARQPGCFGAQLAQANVSLGPREFQLSKEEGTVLTCTVQHTADRLGPPSSTIFTTIQVI